jgi:HIRAN domain.
VVGESFYQEAIRALVGPGGQRVRLPVQATLLAETNNRYDPNAVSVWIGGGLVGHLSREVAGALRPGLLALERQHDGAAISLSGVIAGGATVVPAMACF